jgi:GntR family transcriptional regulator
VTQNVRTWDEDRPIYGQLMEEIVTRILNETYREGALLPSIRQLASESLVNPLTASRAYRELEDYTEPKRGIGLVVKEGARELLLKRERRRFLQEEWPAVRERLNALELDLEDLLEDWKQLMTAG